MAAPADEFSNLVENLEAAVAAAPTPVEKRAVAPAPAQAPTPKAKILFVSQQTSQPTSFAKVSHYFMKELAAIPWLEVVHYAILPMYNAEKATRPSTVRTISALELEKANNKASITGLGIRELPLVISREAPTVVLIYNDIALTCAYLEEIRRSGLKRTFKLWAYVNQLYTFQPRNYIDMLNRDCDRIFAQSKAWRECLKEQGLTRPCDVLGHGIDSSIIRQIPRDIARQAAGIPREAFIFLSMNRNQARSRLDILLIGFIDLILKYPTRPIFLMCVCDKGSEGGYPVFDIFARELALRGASVDTYSNRLMLATQEGCYSDADITMFYNLADVGVSTVEGTGFGLSTLEGMYIGLPHILPDLVGYREYCTPDNSIMIKPSSRYYLPITQSPMSGEAFAISPAALTAAMEKYYLEEDLRGVHAAKARETAKTMNWQAAVAPLIKRIGQLLDDEMEDA
jgi:hypothetical protein